MPFYCGKRFAGICVVLAPKKSSTYSSEYACGFFGAAASHLPASHFPRNERLLGQAPRKTRNGLGSFEPPKLKTAMSNHMKYGRAFSRDSRMLPKTMQRGGPGNSDSVISGSLASPTPPAGGEPEE